MNAPLALARYRVTLEALEPPDDAEALRTHDDIPRPFVIAPPPVSPHEHPAGSHVVFDLTLVGRARQYLPHFVVTFRDMDRIGRGRRKVNLHRIDAVHPLAFWPYLLFGQWIHVGSGTTFGLGRYCLEAMGMP